MNNCENKLKEAIKAARLIKTGIPEIDDIKIFGSVARGTALPASDTDIIIETNQDKYCVIKKARRICVDHKITVTTPTTRGLSIFADRRSKIEMHGKAGRGYYKGIYQDGKSLLEE